MERYTPEQQARLIALGFTWQERGEDWLRSFEGLAAFIYFDKDFSEYCYTFEYWAEDDLFYPRADFHYGKNLDELLNTFFT